MNKKRYFGDFMLFLAAFIWGTAFVAQVTGIDRIVNTTNCKNDSSTGLTFLE